MAEADRDSVIIEQAIADAQIEAQKAAERMPNNDTWGFFSFGDGPPAAGGGVGGFLWFDDRAGMLDFIRRHLTYFSPGPTKSDPQTVNAAVVSLVREFESGNVGEMGTLSRLNAALKGYSQIKWWGTFGQLLTDRADFPKRVRLQFRSIDADEGDSGPVTEAEIREFLEFLTEYGL